MAVSIQIWIFALYFCGPVDDPAVTSADSPYVVAMAANDAPGVVGTSGSELATGKAETTASDRDSRIGGSTKSAALVEQDGGGSDPSASDASRQISAMSLSPHDFTGRTGRVGDACSACHVAHIQGVRSVSDASGKAVLELYRMGSQHDVFVPDRYTPGPTSLICLSCHNGTVASSTVGTAHGLNWRPRDGQGLSDNTMLRDHPIGVPYPTDLKNFRPRSAVEVQGYIRLPNGRLECVSCHDPHNEGGNKKLLAISNRRSALCLSCHRK